MPFELSKRLKRVPPYIFVELDRMKNEAIQRGEDVISLSIGDPDLPTPQIIVDALAEGGADPGNHKYPLGAGQVALRAEIAEYYRRRFRVVLDPASEIISLIGSKEGIGHFPLAFVDEGDVVLCPDPGYPVYSISTIFAGGTPHSMPLHAGNGFLPDLNAIPDDVYSRTKLMFLNYPNNPTAAFAPPEFFEKVVWRAKKHGFIVVHDAAYLDMAFHGKRAFSFLEMPGARDVGIEMHSFSKTFHMTGWRLAFAVGNKELVGGLLRIKSNLDSGVFGAVQHAGIIAMRNFERIVPGLVSVYESRARVLANGLRGIGWGGFTVPEGTFYVWLPNRGGRNSMQMTIDVLENCKIMVTPGTAFGEAGEGYFRIALTAGEERIRQAVERFRKAGI